MPQVTAASDSFELDATVRTVCRRASRCMLVDRVALGCRYRLQPEVVLLEPVVGEKADKLAGLCPGLISVEGSGQQRRAVAGNARQHEKQLEKVLPCGLLCITAGTSNEVGTLLCTVAVLLPCLQDDIYRKMMMQVRRLSGEDKWREHLQLRKRKDHFIFTIESTGILKSDVLFVRAIDVLSAKCDKLLEHL